MRAARVGVEGALPALAAGAAAFCALFFGGGFSDAPLVWIGAVALLAAAALWLWTTPLGARAVAYLACLGGLAVWCGVTMAWSASPEESWRFTNRTLVYLAFAVLGVLVGSRLPQAAERVALGGACLVALVLGWALLEKCVPALYSDYGRVARLRAPIDEWNMLALVCVAGVPLALWLAGRASRLAGTMLLYACAVALLLTYSRFGVALAVAAGLAWVLREDQRVERISDAVVAAAAGAVVFLVAASLNGITSDGQPRSVRAHDGWVFALVLLAGAVAVALASLAIARIPLTAGRRRAAERVAAGLALLAVVAGLVVAGVNGSRIWHSLTNPVAAQTTSTKGHLLQGGGGNRWQWWKEAWRGFTEHPLGGTGAGTFGFTDLRYRQSTDIQTVEPHNTPLQFLTETGIVGFLLFLGAAAVVLAAAWRRRGAAATALGIAVTAFLVHAVVNYDWSFVAVCGPFLLVGGVVVARPAPAPAVRRPLVAAALVVLALGCVYSVAAPWLAERVPATSAAKLEHAHSYDPLSTDILTEWASYEELGGRTLRAEKLYRDALALEPTNAGIWYDLASFYAGYGSWVNAYRALARAYAYDPFGPAGQCGLAAQIRRKVGVATSCRGAGSP